MGGFWYWFTSPNYTKKGLQDAKDGLPKFGSDGEIHIPPQLDIIKQTYEAKMANVAGEWSKSDGDLNAKYKTLEKRKENLAKRPKEANHAASIQYYLIVTFLALLEMPITYIALESVFKENILLVALSCIGFSVLIVWLGHVLGQRFYQEEVVEKSSRMTIIFVVVAVLIVGALSYLRYIHQSNLIFSEKVAIEEQGELDGNTKSPQLMEKIRHLDSKSPALISLAFFIMSAGFTLVATHSSKTHCIKSCDEKFILGLNEYIDEKMVRIQKERETMYRQYEAQLTNLIQSAQREFAEYKNGLVRSENNDGDKMLKLNNVLHNKFAVKMSEALLSYLDVAEKLKNDIKSCSAISNSVCKYFAGCNDRVKKDMESSKDEKGSEPAVEKQTATA